MGKAGGGLMEPQGEEKPIGILGKCSGAIKNWFLADSNNESIKNEAFSDPHKIWHFFGQPWADLVQIYAA